MNDIYSIDFTRMLPPSLKNDPKMIALSQVIADELSKTGQLVRQNIIYARIDELSESVLDVLAYDLHVDWYDYSYPIAAKRAVIKDSIRVHKRLGTKFAVEMALGNVHPESTVEEWFEYSGEPFSFRVILDVTNSRAAAEYFSIKKAVDSYKSMRSHMDDLIYQCRVNIEISVTAQGFKYSTGMTGKREAGTFPYRNIIGAAVNAGVQIMPSGNGYGFSSDLTGTAPYRSTMGALRDSGIVPTVTAEGFAYHVKRCGTSYCKNR